MFVPTAGALVAGRYQLRRVIGQGGMGEVWEAHDTELESSCACKFILQHLAKDQGVRTRFLREARAIARLRSPHAVQILGVGEHEDALYIAMELLEGETLRDRLARVGRLDARTTFAIVEQTALAIEKAHQAGIVHRDLKPDNIWLWPHRDTFIKVLDFGVAKSVLTSVSHQTATGALIGTPHYMSPEQARGDRQVDGRSDLWSLAIITVECLTGKRPFESSGLGDLLIQIVASPIPPLSLLGPGLPPGLQPWWERALARNPDQRFQSAAQLVDSLRLLLMNDSAVTAVAPMEPSAPVTVPTPAGSGAGFGSNAGFGSSGGFDSAGGQDNSISMIPSAEVLSASVPGAPLTSGVPFSAIYPQHNARSSGTPPGATPLSATPLSAATVVGADSATPLANTFTPHTQRPGFTGTRLIALVGGLATAGIVSVTLVLGALHLFGNASPEPTPVPAAASKAATAAAAPLPTPKSEPVPSTQTAAVLPAPAPSAASGASPAPSIIAVPSTVPASTVPAASAAATSGDNPQKSRERPPSSRTAASSARPKKASTTTPRPEQRPAQAEPRAEKPKEPDLVRRLGF